MQYDIDFIGVKTVEKNADAIAMRWREDDNEPFVVGVYDGGFKDYGKALCEHIKKYYKTDHVNFVVCSHPDKDHASGLTEVLENLTVDCLYMNLPWLYIDELFDKVSDGRKTKNTLECDLRKKYQYVDDLEKLANDKNIPIYPCFEGDIIEKTWYVLSPSKEFYLNQIVQSDKTPLEEKEVQESFIVKAAKKLTKWIKEFWNKDSLEENPKTSAENEMSIILAGDLANGALLTADAGILALKAAYEYANKHNVDLSKSISFYQIPHHGGRHNLNSEVMDKIVGKIVDRGVLTNKTAYASTAADNEYPRKAVVNAFIRRGVKVYSTNGITLHHYHDTTNRDWEVAKPLKFSDMVEDPKS